MSDALLAGLRVADLSGEPAALAGRIFVDLGAEVVRVEPPEGHALRHAPPRRGAGGESLRAAAWLAGSTSVILDAADPVLHRLLRGADVVLTSPGAPGVVEADPALAPQAVWVAVTAFGAAGPRAGWRATDLGVMAASGNMHVTGDPQRPPLRCAEPVSRAHGGPEVVLAALTGLAGGRAGVVDVSLQEAVLVANMGGPAEAFRSGNPGRRMGAVTGRTREIWPCRDGHVSFGLRGGPARVPSLTEITRLVEADGLATPALTGRDWTAYSPDRCTDAELRAIEAPIAAYFARRSMAELYALACESHLMLAPAMTPAEILASEQLAARGFLAPLGDLPPAPRCFATLGSADGGLATPGPPPPAPRPGRGPTPGWEPRGLKPGPATTGAWAGTRVLELGSGAAGPIATRYFAEHGATVIRIESRRRPDFLRLYSAQGPEHSPLFAALNCGKLSISLDLKHPDGVGIARRLVAWADAVSENFAPRAMRGLGLDYASLAAAKPDLVMVSACLMGQTGPHRDFPGFGGQGSALSGYNTLTGWPDGEPLGPFGTITDSLAPRFAAVAIAAGLLRRRRTGRGVHVDLSQVEAALYTLSPWLLDHAVNGHSLGRIGNRSPVSAPHGVFPCAGEDRWVAIAAHDDADWAALAAVIGVDDPSLQGAPERLARVDHVEALVAGWTAGRRREEVAAALQERGIEAVPVADFLDLQADPQLRLRGHFVPAVHPALGEMLLERNGFRLDAPAGYSGPAPLLGEHTEMVLGEILGLGAAERARLAESGALR